MDREIVHTATQHFRLNQDWSIIDIWDYESLPDAPGVYVNLRPEDFPGSYRLLYVGKAKSLRVRWANGHHKAINILHSGGTLIGYLQADRRIASMYESEIIRIWSPPLNQKRGEKWREGLSAFQQMKMVSTQLPKLAKMIFERNETSRKEIEEKLKQQYGFEWE